MFSLLEQYASAIIIGFIAIMFILYVSVEVATGVNFVFGLGVLFSLLAVVVVYALITIMMNRKKGSARNYERE